MLPVIDRARSVLRFMRFGDAHEWRRGTCSMQFSYDMVSMHSGAAMAPESLESRLRREVPWTFSEGYGYESTTFRRERYIYMYEHGHSLLSRALEREP